jgi:DNA-binding response OmpR family regulator
MRILVVEDSARLRQSVTTWFRRHGFAVDVSADGEEGLWQAEENNYDAIVLDIMLPKLDGLSLLKKLRQRGNQTHVLLLTARDTVLDRVRGLELGADDYLVKPFALEELLARVKSLCRRNYSNKTSKLTVADLEVDTAARKIRRAGKIILLQPREYALLEYLARRTGHIVTRSEIEAHIYDGELELASNVIDSTICSLRQKIGEINPTPLIHTRRGLGYELVAE